MFAILFLGTILAVFLTLGAVRGDAERGLVQPLLVRPLRRRTLLLGRWLGATAVCAPYVIVVALGAFVLTDALGGWWPDRTIGPLLALALGVAILAALSLAGSIVLAGDRERDRRVHALRRRADRRPAGPDRGGDQLGPAGADLRHRELGAPVRGALPGRARRPDRGHGRVRASSRSTSARSAAPSPAAPPCGSSRWPTWPRSGRRRPPPSRAATSRRAGSRSSAARPRRPAPRRRGCSTPSVSASSPDSYISVMMSQPPTSSPRTNSCGIVGQLESADSSWRIRGSGRMSTAANGVPSASSAAPCARRTRSGAPRACPS